jgi:UDP-glucose 4-epimerase
MTVKNVEKVFVTGCAGFIGSNLVDRLLAVRHEVIGYDNFSTGQERFLEPAQRNGRFRLVRGDLLDERLLTEAMGGSEVVFHMAANADVRYGTQHPRLDMEQNTVATYNVLEAMRHNGIKRLAFPSTGSIYGDATTFPTPEDAPFPVQTSFYGASKLAAEALIEAYCEGFGFKACIFRFVSILGERYTHGHVFDFYRQLKQHPGRLHVLGDGKQRKSYLYIRDCIDAMLLTMEQAQQKVNVFNLGTDDYCQLDDSIGWISEALGVKPVLEYSGGDRGWIGDSPFIFLETRKIRSLGWEPRLSIREGIVRTVEYLRANEWVFEARS